jgi:hypothetical protein
MELQYLVSDIRENGLKMPITLYQGKILDGRNRATACRLVGKEPRYVPFEGRDPLGYVISQNLVRRHLSESQRAMVAAKLVEMKKASADKLSAKLRLTDAAQALNVSDRTVDTAAKVLRDGSPEVIESVERGEKTVHAAVQEMKQSQLDADTPSPVSETDDKIKELRRNILKNAKAVRKDMEELFALTAWNDAYAKLTAELRGIIFDE